MDGAFFSVGQHEFAYLVLEPKSPAGLRELTPAEREVVALVCRGCSNKEIASQRGTSVNTVGNQLAAVYGKLGVASRFELVDLVTRRTASTG
ncbi:MAG: helix-turn-helix transcriptional regulator [Polyangiaceae bacterium]